MRIYLFMHGLAQHFGPGSQMVVLARELQTRNHDVHVVIEQPVAENNQYLRALQTAGIPIYMPGRFLAWLERHSRFNEIMWLFLSPVRLIVTLLDMLIRGRDFERAWRGVRGRFERLFPPTKFAQPCRWGAWLALSKLHKRFPADVVHSMSGMGGVFRWATHTNVPLVYTESAVATLEFGIDWWSDLRRDISSVTFIVAISKIVAKSVYTHLGYTGPIQIIPIMLYGLLQSKETNYSLDKIPQQSNFTIGVAARLDPLKGHCYLIEAIPSILACCHGCINIQFQFVGDGPNKADLLRQIETLGISANVELLGHCDAEKMAAFWRAIDLFVLPTLWEGTPVVLLEAMVYAKPIVASRVGGVPEIVEDGVTGILIPPATPDALANAICELLRQPDRMQAMGRAGRQRFESMYHVDVVMPQLLAAYQETVAKHQVRHRK